MNKSKCSIWNRPIPSLGKLPMQEKEVVLKIKLKRLHVGPPAFSSPEFPPGAKKILNRDHRFKETMKILPGKPPPSDGAELPIIHVIRELHKEIYLLGLKISKRDRFGIHLKIELLSLETLSLAIQASFETKIEKKPTLETLRIKIGLLKQLVRTALEIHSIPESAYLKLQAKLQEISKMVNGWLKYVS